MRNKWANTLTTGVSTTWRGQFVNLLTACWPNSTKKIKKKSQKTNFATFAAATATAVNPQFATLMASIANLDKVWCAPARMWMFIMSAFMAGPTMNTGQQATYLQLFVMLYLLKFLSKTAFPIDPKSGSQRTAPSPKEVPGIDRSKGDKFISFLSASVGRKSQVSGFGGKSIMANQDFRLTSSRLCFPSLKLVVALRVK